MSKQIIHKPFEEYNWFSFSQTRADQMMTQITVPAYEKSLNRYHMYI